MTAFKPISCTETAARMELVLLIHGTGAWRDSQSGDEWWQLPAAENTAEATDIPFGAFIRAAPSGPYEVEPFRWPKGENSERLRRRAGAALLKRLRQLEIEGRNYHLAGHSHGGLVIWHALRATASKPLRHLGCWTTVGTPFLSFRSTRFDLIPVAGFVAVFLMCVALLPRAFDIWDSIDTILREAPLWAVIVSCGLALVLVLAGLVAGFLAIQPVRRSLGQARERRRDALAADLYESRWLGIWHGEDEAIGALRASIGTIPEIIPRTSRIARLTGRALDQIVWFLVIRRTSQGADLLGLALEDVDTQPTCFRTRCPELPASIGDSMLARSQQRIGPVVAGLRQLLGRGYLTGNTDVLIEGAKRHFDFKALVHNSYFDDPEIRARVLAHIARHSGKNSSSAPPKTDAEGDDAVPPAAPAGDRLRAGRLFWLEAVSSLAIVAAVLLLALVLTNVVDSRIMPWTDQYQVERIAESALQTELINVDVAAPVGQILGFLSRRGFLEDPIPAVNLISDREILRGVLLDLGNQVIEARPDIFLAVENYAKKKFRGEDFSWTKTSGLSVIHEDSDRWRISRGSRLAAVLADKSDYIAFQTLRLSRLLRFTDARDPEEAFNHFRGLEDAVRQSGIEPCAAAALTLEIFFLSLDVFPRDHRASENSRQQFDRDLAQYVRTQYPCLANARAPLHKPELIVLAHGRALPQLFGLLVRGSRPNVEQRQQGTLLEAQYSYAKLGLSRRTVTAIRRLSAAPDADWRGRFHLARALRVVTMDNRQSAQSDRDVAGRFSREIASQAFDIVQNLDFEATVRSLLETMSFARRLNLDPSAIWDHAAALIRGDPAGHPSVIVSAAAFVVNAAPADRVANAKDLARYIWGKIDEWAPQLDLDAQLSARRSIAVAMGSLVSPDDLITANARINAAKWIEAIADNARNHNKQEARAEAQADAVELLARYDNLPGATKSALNIERPQAKIRAFVAILAAVGERSWDGASSWLRSAAELVAVL